MVCIAKIKAYITRAMLPPSLAQSTAVDSCMTKVRGVNMKLEWRKMNTSTLQAGLTTKTCQSCLIKLILLTRNNPIILFVSLLSNIEEYK